MSGMILSGSDPIYAAIYQFVVIAMIFAAAGLTAVPSVLMIRSWIFSPAEQLILRPGDGGDNV
jgi:putative ABC transport system permease protein